MSILKVKILWCCHNSGKSNHSKNIGRLKQMDGQVVKIWLNWAEQATDRNFLAQYIRKNQRYHIIVWFKIAIHNIKS